MSPLSGAPMALGAGVFTLPGFMTPHECEAQMALARSLGYQDATIRTDDGDARLEAVRNNDRVIRDDPALAVRLFERARPFLPASLDGLVLHRLNERFRHYRYQPGQKFAWHIDGSVRPVPGERSRLTFMVYLNDGFEGGDTQFGWESVKAVAGTALVFPHHLRHQGAVVLAGEKHVLRSDVIYRGDEASPAA
jgi:predicted 2-oxoglutarate/Fe(II)-dependent dioxygenase YbiX